MDERGSISVFCVGILAATGMALLLLGHMGADAVRRARVAAVADVVALAAAAEPETAAGIAMANGASLAMSINEGHQAEVVVRREGVTAVARAEFLPARWWLCQSLPTGHPVHFESCPSTPIR